MRLGTTYITKASQSQHPLKSIRKEKINPDWMLGTLHLIIFCVIPGLSSLQYFFKFIIVAWIYVFSIQESAPRWEVLSFSFSFVRNTFVLEYCGEVLDHKEFKARVKEYARNKNIHYYFMALKNDEVSSLRMFALKCIWKLLSLKGLLIWADF